MSDPTVIGSYEPALPSPRDQMRARVGDIGPVFLIPDVTYDAQLTTASDWRLAAAAIALQLAAMYEQDPNSFTATGDFSVGFVDRGRALRTLAAQLQREVAAEQSASGGVNSLAPERDDEGFRGEYTYRRQHRRFS